MFDWTFISHYAPFFVSGAEMTLFISVFGIILAIVVGLVCAGIEITRIPVLRQVVNCAPSSDSASSAAPIWPKRCAAA